MTVTAFPIASPFGSPFGEISTLPWLGGAAAVYAANATKFDGTNDRLLRGGDLTGAADGKQILISAWIKRNTDGVLGQIFTNTGAALQFLQLADNTVKVSVENAIGSVIATLVGTTAHLSGSFYHALISIDLAVSGSGYMYINDVAEVSAYTGINDTIDLTITNWGVGAKTNGNAKFDGCISELYYEDTYLDLSVESNRRKFIDASGNPVDLGSDGSTPTGASPLVYLPNAYGTFEQNAGTGGDFTVSGALEACSSSPSD